LTFFYKRFSFKKAAQSEFPLSLRMGLTEKKSDSNGGPTGQLGEMRLITCVASKEGTGQILLFLSGQHSVIIKKILAVWVTS
jgi:hypothetical protein